MNRIVLEKLTEQKESPEYLQVSMAATMTLGIRKNFIRVEWPTVKLDDIIERAKKVGHVERL